MEYQEFLAAYASSVFFRTAILMVPTSVTRFGNLFDFVPLFKAFGNN